MSSKTIPRRDMLGIAAAAVAIGSSPARIAAADAAPMRALVLSGGGAHGAYEAGIIAGLVQAGALDAYDVICGTSIGSLNAMLVATGQGAQVRALWSSIAAQNVLRPKPEFAAFDGRRSAIARGLAALRFVYGATRGRVTGFVDATALRKIISQYALLPDGRTPRPFVRPLLWTATDLTAGHGVGFVRGATGANAGRTLPALSQVFASPARAGLLTQVADSDLVAALQASTAIPGVFDPVTLPSGSSAYVDGGVLSNSPVNLAQYAGATRIDLVILAASVQGRGSFPNATAIVEQAYGIMRQRILDDALTFALFQSDDGVRAAIENAVRRGPLHDQVPLNIQGLYGTTRTAAQLRIITPSKPLAGSGLDAGNQTLIDQNIALGLNDFTQIGFQPITQPLR
jgi:predicted acylesterase/phospholipase RssA